MSSDKGLHDISDHDLLIEINTKLETALSEIQTFKDEYVTQKEFSPVKSIVYGMISVILLAVVAALVGLVVVK